MKVKQYLDGRPPQFKRSTLKEIFFFRMFKDFVREGDVRPRFYLPVRRTRNDQFIECYFVLLAPFVLIYFILKGALVSMWYDLVDVAELVSVWSRMNGKGARRVSKERLSRAVKNSVK